MAGRRALEHSANVEAASHLHKGLELLRTLPENVQRDEHELELLTSLGVAKSALKSYADSEVEKIYTRARELCKRLNDSPRVSSALLGLWKNALVRADLQRAHALAQECLELVQRRQDPELLLAAHLTLGVTLFLLGELITAHQHLLQVVRLYEKAEYHSDIFNYGEDPGAVCLAYLAFVLWALGYPEEALKRNNEAKNLAHRLGHPFTQALVLNFSAGLYECRREYQRVLEEGEALLALATEQGFPFWQACGMVNKGSALFKLGQREEGINWIDRGIAIFHASGARIGHSGGLVQRAMAKGEMGEVESGLEMIAEAVEIVKSGGERQEEAELYRFKGELLLLPPKGDEQQAEICFLQALDIARRQQAKSWELRATMSLARLWKKQNKRAAAQALLSEIYNWFTEGFDTADLQEAKALLEELAK
jgi:predicted ATPase